MLKQTEHTETPATNAASVRVTPEELAAAVARLEARRAGADGTISIGDAITELSLDATPEEVFAEVQAVSIATLQQNSLQKSRLRVYSIVGLVLCGLLASFYLLNQPPPTILTATSSLADVPSQIQYGTHLPVGDAHGNIRLLSEVGNEQPVHCGYSSFFLEPFPPSRPTATWTIIKHSGQVYIRGWIRQMSRQMLQVNGADVSASRKSGGMGFVVPVTLSISNFTIDHDASNVPVSVLNLLPDEGFHANNIHLDKYAYEKWKP